MGQQIILFDENLSTSTKTLSGQLCRLLETRGWTCYSVHDIPELLGHSDEEVIAYVKKQDWALLTLDKRMAYLAVNDQVSVYLALHEKRESDAGESEGLTVVQLFPLAEVQSQKTIQAAFAGEKQLR